MKKIMFFSILLSLIFSLYPEIVNPDKPLQGDWDLKAQKIWETSRYGKKPMAVPGLRCISEDGTICVYDWKRRENLFIIPFPWSYYKKRVFVHGAGR